VTEPARGRPWQDVVTAALVVVVAAGHLLFALADDRLPRDPDDAYSSVPGLYLAWRTFPEGLGDVLVALLEPGGWLAALVAAW
jgi:hypothetical protein